MVPNHGITSPLKLLCFQAKEKAEALQRYEAELEERSLEPLQKKWSLVFEGIFVGD